MVLASHLANPILSILMTINCFDLESMAKQLELRQPLCQIVRQTK
jgi:hypothetical protein